MAESETLDEIGLRLGTDKSSAAHNYLKLYERRLGTFRLDRLTLFEIGVLRGQSIAMWSEFFPNATIVGLDINPACKAYEAGNKHVRIGEQSDGRFLRSVMAEFGAPRIVIDDGSHLWSDQIATFRELFPALAAGGIYIIEDIDTSFPGYQAAGHDYSGGSAISAFDYIMKLTRSLTGGGHAINEEPGDRYQIETVEFASQVVLVGKT
jgi:hypothetical protein